MIAHGGTPLIAIVDDACRDVRPPAAREASAEGSRIPTLFITAHGDAQVRTQAMNAGAIEVLFKPFDDELLLDRVRAALTS